MQITVKLLTSYNSRLYAAGEQIEVLPEHEEIFRAHYGVEKGKKPKPQEAPAQSDAELRAAKLQATVAANNVAVTTPELV